MNSEFQDDRGERIPGAVSSINSTTSAEKKKSAGAENQNETNSDRPSIDTCRPTDFEIRNMLETLDMNHIPSDIHPILSLSQNGYRGVTCANTKAFSYNSAITWKGSKYRIHSGIDLESAGKMFDKSWKIALSCAARLDPFIWLTHFGRCLKYSMGISDLSWTRSLGGGMESG